MLSTQSAIEAYRDQAVQLFCDVFSTMLHLEVYPAAEGNLLVPGQVTSCVYFAGCWKGAALIDCSLDLAKHFTERLMPGCYPTGFDDDVRDCMGELANMIGGNLKALLPDHVDLSMPSVVEGSNYSVRLCGSNAFLQLPFVCERGAFWITIVEVVN
jgi:chemotaxis protein CheX